MKYVALILMPLCATALSLGAETLWQQTANEGVEKIEIRNDYGNVTLRSSVDRNLSITGSNASVVEQASEDLLTLEIRSGDEPSRTDVTIFVPSSKHLTVLTTRGEITNFGVDRIPMRLASTTGPITLMTTPSSSLAVSAATSGELTSDFSVDIDHAWDREPSKHASITIGEGQTSVSLHSIRGHLLILRGSVTETDADSD